MKKLSECSTAELVALRESTDKAHSPLRYAAVCEALDKRSRRQTCLGMPANEVDPGSLEVPINAWFVRVISVLTIGGCFIGLTTIINHLMSPQGLFSYLIFALFFATFVLGIVISIRLVERCTLGALTDNRNFWAIQTFFFSSPIMAYQLTNGLLINIWITNNDGWQHGFMIGSAFSLNFLNVNQPWALGINLVAIAITVYLQITALPDGIQLPRPYNLIPVRIALSRLVFRAGAREQSFACAAHRSSRIRSFKNVSDGR